MRKILVFLGFIIYLTLFVFVLPSAAQECIPLYRSCDESHICCNFPTNACIGGYCKPNDLHCGGVPQDQNPYCCPSPNPPCANGFVCQGGYCVLSSTPTPTPTCGMPFQKCCPTEPKCISPFRGSVMVCIAGSCVPETTNCGNLGQPCCPSEPKCRTTNTECREGTCQSIQASPTYKETPSAEEGESQPTACTGSYGEGIQTALGCIPTKDTTKFIGWLLGSAIKIVGGIAFLLIILGAIKVLTSSGSPEAVKAGQEMITSALMGLLFIIFSLFLLELIGVKILQIPGFGQ